MIEYDSLRIKRNIKDSVFTDLFGRKKYLVRLYKTLHPDKNITEKDIEIITLSNVLVNAIYNDLGFIVDNKLIILVECQSTWSINILIRFLLYIAQTYLQFIKKHKFNLYGTQKINIPKPELYVIYTGDKKIDKEYISFSEEFFNNETSDINIRAKVIQANQCGDIIDEYITFVKVFNKQVKIHGMTRTAILSAIRICKNKNVLNEYLAEHESEVCNIMITLFDEDEIMEMYMHEVTEKAQTEGMAQGMAQGIENEKVSNIKNLMETLKFTVEQAMTALKVPASEHEKYKQLINK